MDREGPEMPCSRRLSANASALEELRRKRMETSESLINDEARRVLLTASSGSRVSR